MSDSVLDHARALVAHRARGAPVLDALHDEALTLLDEHEDALAEGPAGAAHEAGRGGAGAAGITVSPPFRA